MGIYNRPSVTHIHRSHLCLADDCLTEHAAAHGRQSNQQAAATVSKHEGTFTEKILGTVFEGEEVRSAKKKVATLHLKKKKKGICSVGRLSCWRQNCQVSNTKH